MKIKSFAAKTLLIAGYFISFLILGVIISLLRGKTPREIIALASQAQFVWSVLLLFPSVLILVLLRHQVIWLLVLFLLAMLGVGTANPYLVLVSPERMSVVPMSITLACVLIFWLFEILEAKYIGYERPGYVVDSNGSEVDPLTLLDLSGKPSNNRLDPRS